MSQVRILVGPLMKESSKKIKTKVRNDRLLRVSHSEEELGDFVEHNAWPQEMMITGSLDLGKSGNPVTIFLEDEVTGEQLEIAGVRNAFLIMEDSRKATSGWLAMAVGSIDKMGEVLNFLSQTTLETLKKLAKRG